jgi:hypothetical protein
MSVGRFVALLSLAAPCLASNASDALLEDLNRRLTAEGIAGVNTYLSANWETKMSELGDLTRRCDARALLLSITLLETTNAEALLGHTYSLEIAMGRCPERLLPLVSAAHVPMLCDIVTYEEAHPNSNVLKEIDRRVARLQGLKGIAPPANWSACVESYRAARLTRQYR